MYCKYKPYGAFYSLEFDMNSNKCEENEEISLVLGVDLKTSEKISEIFACF